jgi:hypothetical protein
MRLFRQTERGNWRDVLARIALAIQKREIDGNPSAC